MIARVLVVVNLSHRNRHH